MTLYRRALISVSNKSDILKLGRALSKHNVEILSTGGTARVLLEANIPVIPIAKYTSAPEILGGRVKTLHPKIYGGILARDLPEDTKEIASHQIPPIDLVVVNLYPFEETLAKDASHEELIEKIDIGGPTLLRAAAKNYSRVTVVCDPGDYSKIIDALENSELSLAFRKELAQKVFAHVSAYDANIASYLSGEILPEEKDFSENFSISGKLVRTLRYGENPHQKSALYETINKDGLRLSIPSLQGKPLSFNNLLDLDAALSAVCEFAQPAVVAVKHTTPCGVARADTIEMAYSLAQKADPTSIFGGVVALNRPVGRTLAKEMSQIFLEAIAAPSFSEEAREIFSQKKNLRLLEMGELSSKSIRQGMTIRSVFGGFLLQERDTTLLDPKEGNLVTKRVPSEDEYQALDLAWRVVKHVKSNAIVLAAKNETVGIGAGQMSRVDASLLAIQKAKSFQKELKGTVAASDAFFPFRDGLETLAGVGVTAVIQPGGSIRDQEVIDAANEHNIAMIFTNERHFRH